VKITLNDITKIMKDINTQLKKDDEPLTELQEDTIYQIILRRLKT
jgi:hypothetical protein